MNSLDVYNFTASSTGGAIARADWTRDTNYAYMSLYENGIYQGYDIGSSGLSFAYNFLSGRTYTMMVLMTDTDNFDTNITFSIEP